MEIETIDVLRILRDYRCQYTFDENQDGIELLDMITPPRDSEISRGLLELELLADHIANGLNLIIEESLK